MAHKIGDRIKEQASTSGTGAFTLAGALAGFDGFASALTADGDTTWYCAVNDTQWEIGLGTRTAAGVLARTAVINSSNADVLVNFSAPPIVFATVPASKIAQPKNPDSQPATPNAADDEFEGTALDTSGARRAGASAWGTFTPAGATFTQGDGALLIAVGSNAGAENIRAAEQVLPAAGMWKYRAKVWGTWAQHNANASVGVMLRNTANSRIVGAYKQRNSNTPYDFVACSKWNSGTSWNSLYYGPSDAVNVGAGTASNPSYFEIEWDGANYKFRISPSGLLGSFKEIASFPPADFIGTADRIGIFCNPVSQAVSVHCEWFRRVA